MVMFFFISTSSVLQLWKLGVIEILVKATVKSLVLQVKKSGRMYFWPLYIHTQTLVHTAVYFCSLTFHSSLDKKNAGVFLVCSSLFLHLLFFFFPFDFCSISVPFALYPFTYLSLLLLCSSLTSCQFFCLHVYVFFHLFYSHRHFRPSVHLVLWTIFAPHVPWTFFKLTLNRVM